VFFDRLFWFRVTCFFIVNVIAIQRNIPYIRFSKTLTFLKSMLLKELLKSKGLKQKWLANKIGVSEVTVSNWCSGKSVPKRAHLQKISEILEVPVKAIINI